MNPRLSFALILTFDVEAPGISGILRSEK